MVGAQFNAPPTHELKTLECRTPTEGDHKGLRPTAAPPPPLLGLRAPAGRLRGPSKGRGGGGEEWGLLWLPSVGI